MGKNRHVYESQSKEKKLKKMDFVCTASDKIQNKFAWILENQPQVLVEKLSSKYSSIPNTSSSNLASDKLDTNSKNSSQFTSKLPIAFSKIVSDSQVSKKSLPKRVDFTSCSFQSSQKKSRNSTGHRESSKKKSSSKYRLISSEGSSEGEVLRISKVFGKISGRSGVNVCTQDPNRVTPCENECCIQFPLEKKISEKKSFSQIPKPSTSKGERRKFFSQSSQKTTEKTQKPTEKTQKTIEKTQKTIEKTLEKIQKTIEKPYVSKRSKDRRPRTKEKHERSKSQSSVSIPTQEESQPVRKKLAVFTKRSSSQSSCTTDRSTDESLIFKFFEKKQTSVNKVGNIKGFSFHLEQNNFLKIKSPARLTGPSSSVAGPSSSVAGPSSSLAGPSKKVSKTPQTKEHPTSTKKVEKSRTALSLHPKPSLVEKPKTLSLLPKPSLVLNKGIKRGEYFPDLIVRSAYEGDLKTSHPKASVNNHTQSQMLEASTFPKTNTVNSSFNKSKILYKRGNVTYVSPLSYQENELKSSQFISNYRIPILPKVKESDSITDSSYLPSQSGIQNYQESDNFLAKNSEDLNFLGNNEVNNGFDYCEKDRFRESELETSRANGAGLMDIKLNEHVNLEPDRITYSQANDLDLDKGELLLGNHLPYSNYLQKEPADELQNAKRNISAFENSIECDDSHLLDFNGVMEMIQTDINTSQPQNTQSPSITSSQKKTAKITKCETLPRNCIQMLRRPKSFNRIDKEVQEPSSFCDFEKVAVINKAYLDQRSKTELFSSQESPYDYMIPEELINNFNLPIMQEESALFSSSILDPNNDLENLNYDGFLVDDLANNTENYDNVNNERLVSHTNGDIVSCNSIDIKDSIQSTEDPSLSEVIKLFDQDGRSCLVSMPTDNNIATFDDLINDTKNLNEIPIVPNFTLDNVEKPNDVIDFKEPCQNLVNLVNTENEKVNNDSDSGYYRKRKWFDEKKKCASDPVKKVKLKRRRWNHTLNDGDDLTDASSEISSSCKSSYDPDQSVCQPNYLELADLNQNLDKTVREPKTVNEPKPSTLLSITDLRMKLNFKELNFGESKPEIKTEVKEEVKKSLVDDEPQLQSQLKQEESVIVPLPIQKPKVAPVHRRRRSLKNRSKFQSSRFSSTSSTSSDDECENKPSLSSDEEREKNDFLLKQRIQKELRNVGDNENSNIAENELKVFNDSISNDDKEDDILSVCASPSLMNLSFSRCVTPILEVSKIIPSEPSYNEDFCWETYKRKNDAELGFDLRHLVEKKQAEKKSLKSAQNNAETDKTDNLFTKPSLPVNNVPTKIEAPSTSNATKTEVTNAQQPNGIQFARFFFGVCFNFLHYGTCTKNGCIYKHWIPDHLNLFTNHSELNIFNIVKDGIKMGFKFYLSAVYKIAIQRLGYDLGVQLYNQLFHFNLISQDNFADTLRILKQKDQSLGKVFQNIIEPLQANNPLLFVVLIDIEKTVPPKEYWEVIKHLVAKINFNQHMLEKILHQCMNDSKNINRMNEVCQFMTSFHYYQLVNIDLWTTFYNLVNLRNNENTNQHFASDIDMTLSFDNTGIASPDGISRSSPATFDQNPDLDPVEQNPLQNPLSPLAAEEFKSTDCKTQYAVFPITDLPPAQQNHKDNSNLWKFYDHLESLKRGLRHEDYNYVVSIVKHYSSRSDRTLFTRHCHRVLAEEIKKSQIHVDNIIKIAVQTGELCKLREILSHLGTNVLIELADQGLWVHAYELLKTLQNYELHDKNAGFILLSAEIYLANHRLENALTLLKQNAIIFTDSERWKVKSNNEDVHLRILVITLLLESLCQEHAEKAFFVFDLILGDQRSTYYPIDLTRILDKLMLSLICQNHIDQVMNLCRRAMKYYLSFHQTTYRIVITTLVPVDMALARQFYQYATYLGIYTTIRTKSVMCLIINIDWSEEEMYLVLSEFLRKLFLDVGFAASHIGTKTLAVSFVLESIPTRRQLFDSSCEVIKNSVNLNKSKALLKDILQTRFDPPITIVKKEQGKICKINGQSLVRYLQAGHFNT